MMSNNQQKVIQTYRRPEHSTTRAIYHKCLAGLQTVLCAKLATVQTLSDLLLNAISNEGLEYFTKCGANEIGCMSSMELALALIPHLLASIWQVPSLVLQRR
jgi:hypothetical protein